MRVDKDGNIILRQTSGLGNQLFQYAAGVFYAERLGVPFEVLVEPEAQAVSHGSPRPFQLSQFCITAPVRQVQRLDRLRFANKPVLREIGTLLRRATGVQEWTETPAEYYRLIPDLPVRPSTRTLYLKGYWQNYKIAATVEGRLRRDFQLREKPQPQTQELLKQIANEKEAVSLHVRRGDYVMTTEPQGALGMEYYRRAIAEIRERLPSPRFYVFSDDMAYTRSHLPAELPAVFVEHTDVFTAPEDLFMMAACRHHIIANSSFSWWGAWLNNRTDKIVFAPRPWHRDGRETTGLLPPEWMQLDRAGRQP